ncbi:hypothetical protein C8N46_101659 [Kordia periserrulae]|uniref:Uncharacterized protein n=1 Tax=Kordia periserrulae TaxID=701523 RepID=A0A2T6C6V2_9FLAO|nr:hypothetical protein [Kordia periserrulae]PTX64049.1 hypothetical protein C8N46_101659 [Kordia periserrulae]
MNVVYTSLFKVAVSHSYYASNICECMSYKASATTEKILSKYGIVLRNEHDGFEIYTTANQSIETFLTYITNVAGHTAFEFEGVANDQNFYNFTNIPINNVGVLTYESNQTIAEASSTTIQLQETFVPSNTAANALKVTIYFDDIIRLQQTNDHVQFGIQLQARKTQWNYYIINNSNQEYNQLEIQSTDENIQFSDATEVTLQNNQKALRFTSNTSQIPLKNEVTYQFNLINTRKTIAGERKEIIIKGLPIPNPQNISIQNDHTIASLMYVYI